MVFDKEGKFVEGLTREHFELKIDNNPRAISFFDRLTAGSTSEIQKYRPEGQAQVTQPTPGILSTARTLVFFVDDLHLSQESVYRTRTALHHYIDNSMGQNDRVMITSTTGQIGFLQQLTDNKLVLHAAVERINYHEPLLPNDNRPPMSPYQALRVAENDNQVLNYFADIALKDQFSKVAASQGAGGGNATTKEARGDMQRKMAEDFVRNRAKNLIQQYSTVSASTFAVLRNFLGSLTQLPGSKMAFLISDGFFLNTQMIGELQKLNEITSNALRSGVVVYSVQASGLSNSYIENTKASKDVRLSPRLDPGVPGVGEDTALQAPLYTIAVDSGGRAFFNSNSMDASIRDALRETSEYYLIAWRPEPNESRSAEFRRIHLSVKDHPDWQVRIQKGYFAKKETSDLTDSARANTSNVATEKTNAALTAAHPRSDLPVRVSASFLDVPNVGLQVTVSSEVTVSKSETESETPSRKFDVTGLLLNDEGKTVSSFGGQMAVEGQATSPPSRNYSGSRSDVLTVKPGIYQARVAVRDEATNVVGSSFEWIVVPDLSKGRLNLSSIVVGEASNQTSQARLSVSRTFSRNSKLRFLTYIYNVSRGPGSRGSPDVAVQLQLVRDDKIISTSPLTKISLTGLDDLDRIPYAAGLSLHLLTPGRYLLVINATDNATKSSASQSIKFALD
jgi:VWFA-related protein